MSRRKQFPLTLYVKTEDDGDTFFFLADDTLTNFATVGEKAKVAVYTLERTGTIKGVVDWKND